MTKNLTPWQKVHAKFGVRPSELAGLLGRHRSKISRALSDQKGLISGEDQLLIMNAADIAGVSLEASDLLPEFK